jgi:hypothetical protein
MTPNGLGLDTANRTQGIEVIPAGTQVELVMKIKAGTTGLEDLLKRSSNGESEGLDCEFTVRGGEFDGRKLFDWMTLKGTKAGHATAGEISRSKLRAIFEAVHGIDQNDNTPATIARRANATLADFNGATFLATVEIERGGKRPDGGNYRDKNIIGKILRIGDQGYRRLEQPPPQPIVRSAPPQPQTSAAPGGTPAMAAPPIARPTWAE